MLFFIVARGDHKEVREMIVAAFGCNVAWRVVDAVFYLMHRFSQRGHFEAYLVDFRAGRILANYRS